MQVFYELDEFLSAIENRSCPVGAILSIEQPLSIENMHSIAHALISGNCPKNIALELGQNKLTAEQVAVITQALESGQCSTGLRIDLEKNGLDISHIQLIADALLSGNCPEGLTLDLSHNKHDEESIRLITTALQSTKCPSELNLSFANCKLNDQNIFDIEQALSSGNCPTGLKIDLANNDLTEKNIRRLTTALRSGKCPVGLNLNLQNNNLDIDKVSSIIGALSYGQCPDGLQLSLANNPLGNIFCVLLDKARLSIKYPTNFYLDLSTTGLTAVGAKNVINAFTYQHLEGLTINLASNFINRKNAAIILDQLLAQGYYQYIKIAGVEMIENFFQILNTEQYTFGLTIKDLSPRAKNLLTVLSAVKNSLEEQMRLNSYTTDGIEQIILHLINEHPSFIYGPIAETFYVFFNNWIIHLNSSKENDPEKFLFDKSALTNLFLIFKEHLTIKASQAMPLEIRENWENKLSYLSAALEKLTVPELHTHDNLPTEPQLKRTPLSIREISKIARTRLGLCKNHESTSEDSGKGKSSRPFPYS